MRLTVCEDSPGAQAWRVWENHPTSSRKPKRQSRHHFCQRRWYQVWIKKGVLTIHTYICNNFCFLANTGDFCMPLERTTRLVISSGWAQTAGAQRSRQWCTRKKWQRELSPSCQSDSPSKVRGGALGMHDTSVFSKPVCIIHFKKCNCIFTLTILICHGNKRNCAASKQ